MEIIKNCDFDFEVLDCPQLICSVKDCGLPIRAAGMCKKHRQRFLEYGRTYKVMTGEKVKHPLYVMWNKRRRIKNAFVSEWMNFDIFINAVGDKPKDHYLSSLDKTGPCGPDNFEWRKIKHKRLAGESFKEYNIRRRKDFSVENPLAARERNYKHTFGISLEIYNQKLKEQNFVCAICEQSETATYKNTGMVRNLAVDHCHKTGNIRKLLCSKCNLFVGKLEDNLNRIDKFINYIKDHERWG